MKLMTKAKAAVAVAALGAATAAQAELPANVTTAINTGFADAREAATLVIVGLASIFAILLIRRVLK